CDRNDEYLDTIEEQIAFFVRENEGIDPHVPHVLRRATVILLCMSEAKTHLGLENGVAEIRVSELVTFPQELVLDGAHVLEVFPWGPQKHISWGSSPLALSFLLLAKAQHDIVYHVKAWPSKMMLLLSSMELGHYELMTTTQNNNLLIYLIHLQNIMYNIVFGVFRILCYRYSNIDIIPDNSWIVFRRASLRFLIDLYDTYEDSLEDKPLKPLTAEDHAQDSSIVFHQASYVYTIHNYKDDKHEHVNIL
ncbi:hypothetical protein ACJX0J_012430, partial [Zea mays]